MNNVSFTFLLFGIAYPFAFACSLAEGVILSRHSSFDWRAFRISLLDLALRTLVQAVIRVTVASPFIYLAWKFRLADLRPDSPWSVALLFLGLEFLYYWYHRAEHRIHWFWCNHAVHHSPTALNLSASYRIGFLGQVSGRDLFFVPLIWLGFEPIVVLQALALNLLYQFWLHNTWTPKLGFLEYVLNTPSAHRVHHAINDEYVDRNFGGVLIIFDRLFGTYAEESITNPCVFGLIGRSPGHNYVDIQFGEWKWLWAKVRQRPGLGATLKAVFGPPEAGHEVSTSPLAASTFQSEAVDQPLAPRDASMASCCDEATEPGSNGG